MIFFQLNVKGDLLGIMPIVKYNFMFNNLMPFWDSSDTKICEVKL